MPSGGRRLARQCHEVQRLLHLDQALRRVHTVYARYFPVDPPARIFVCTPEWFGPFDVEIDCIAMA